MKSAKKSSKLKKEEENVPKENSKSEIELKKEVHASVSVSAPASGSSK